MYLRLTVFWAALSALAGVATAPASGALLPGHIAIIGIYTDGNSNDANGAGDAFAWVALADLAEGEVIHFSDTGYYATQAANNGFGNSEGLLTYTVPAGGLTAGTVVTASNAAPDAPDLSLAGLPSAGTGYATGPSAYSAGGHVNLSADGDQLVAFQDPDVSDTDGFSAIYAATVSSSTWTPDPIVNGDNNQTNLYPGLIDGFTAVALGSGPGNQDEFDNARYIGTTVGSAAQLLASISNPVNWERTDASAPALSRDWGTNGVARFTVVPEPSAALLLAAAGAALAAGSRARRGK